MNEQQGTQQGTEARVQSRCLCQEVVSHMRECFAISPAVRQHLANSRVEFLKAIRAAIDERIERVAAGSQAGTKVRVE